MRSGEDEAKERGVIVVAAVVVATCGSIILLKATELHIAWWS